MAKIIFGEVSAKDVKLSIVVARFNDLITKELLRGAEDAFLRYGGDTDHLTVYKVPGAYEIPGLVRKLAATGKQDAIIALGAVIRGSTPHFDYVAGEVAKGVAMVSMEANIPVIFGVLTVESIEQAIERAGTKMGNKGADAVNDALEMISLYRKVGVAG